jgi:hypothetical protein
VDDNSWVFFKADTRIKKKKENNEEKKWKKKATLWLLVRHAPP